MSTLFGNICLVLAALIFSILFSSFFSLKISTSNDQGASGYMILIVLFIHLVFLGLITLSCIAIARQGGFDWISQHSLPRILFLSIGLLSLVSASAISMMGRIAPGSDSDSFQLLSKFAPPLILIIIIGSGLILNNSSLRASVPGSVYKWPLTLMSGFSLAGILFLIVSAFFSSPSGLQDSTRDYENAESIKESRLTQIDELDPSADRMRLLGFTSGLYPTEVREKAAAKFKTDSTWQTELIRILESDEALEAFSFLQSNEVDDKSLFVQPINKGILTAAARFRHDIQATSPSAFYKDMFTDEVNRILLTEEKFDGMGMDYLPTMRELRSALDEPLGREIVKFDCKATLDAWIKSKQ